MRRDINELVSDDEDFAESDNEVFNEDGLGDVDVEAVEDNEAAIREILGDNRAVEDEGEGSDLDDYHEADYTAIPELDRYDEDVLDDEEYGGLTAAQRKAAEEAMNRRDRQEQFDDDDDDIDEDEGREDRLRYLRRRAVEDEDGSMLIVEDETSSPERVKFDEERARRLGNIFRCLLRLYIRDEKGNLVRRDLATIDNFPSCSGAEELNLKLKQTPSFGTELIRNAVMQERHSITIDYSIHITSTFPGLSLWLAEVPEKVLPVLSDIAKEECSRKFPEYLRKPNVPPFTLRIRGLPVLDYIRDLKVDFLGMLVNFRAVVTRRSVVHPRLREVTVGCSCGYEAMPVEIGAGKSIRQVLQGTCPECQSMGTFQLKTESTLYENYQVLLCQERPCDTLAGRVPRSKEVVLTGDLVDKVKPGESIEVCGVFKQKQDVGLNVRSSFPLCSTIVIASSVARVNDLVETDVAEEDKDIIRSLAKDPKIRDRILCSIAPSIYGHNTIKAGIAAAMFGGRRKMASGKHRLRGDINVLVLGDPGVAKSQFLKYVEKIFYKTVYTTGKGASAVGLTAAVRRDPVTSEFVLEGGALVMADEGICLIDEFDKMSEQDRTSIHEAMEQQSISISKAGIVASLQAKCAVIAAANPLGGRYNPSLSFQDNVDLTEPILSRFDVLSVIRDEVDPLNDERLAEFVVNSHAASNPFNPQNATQAAMENAKVQELSRANQAVEPISQDMLKKYILYARRHCFPRLTGSVKETRIASLYTKMREQSQNTGGIKLTVRHLESLIRLSEANARMRLSDRVEDQDIDDAISLTIHSFAKSQKHAIAQSIYRVFNRYLSEGGDTTGLVEHILSQAVRSKASYALYTGNSRDEEDIEAVSVAELEQAITAKATDMDSGKARIAVSAFLASSRFQSRWKLDDKNRIVRRSALGDLDSA